MDTRFHEAIRAVLLDSRAQLEKRLEAIRADRRHQSAPLDPDFEDQAIQRENDEALDALDARGRQELEAVDSALSRLRTGTFGRCVRCGEPISVERLRAQPTAEACLSCKQGEAG